MDLCSFLSILLLHVFTCTYMYLSHFLSPLSILSPLLNPCYSIHSFPPLLTLPFLSLTTPCCINSCPPFIYSSILFIFSLYSFLPSCTIHPFYLFISFVSLYLHCTLYIVHVHCISFMLLGLAL